MRFPVKAAVAASFLDHALAHPLCGLGLVFFESPVARSLSFCSQYNDATCFSTEDDASAQLQFETETEMDEACAILHKQFLCAGGDPYQAHLFDLESSEPNRIEPFLCKNWCEEYADSCDFPVNCTALVGESPYCFPVDLPRAGTGGLEEVISIPNALLIDYADPGQDCLYDLWASFDGVIYRSTKENRQAKPTEFLRLDNVFNQGELGFLTFELDPEYDNNGVVWAFYSVQEDGTRFNVLTRFTPNTSTPNIPWNHCEILRLQQRGWNHNGGDIEFIGRDLYLSIGDDAPQNGNGNAQDRGNLYGTIIRITPKLTGCNNTYNDHEIENNLNTSITSNYDIPSDNPFVNTTDARSEIYAYGFRNPWRMFQDEGLLYTGDVGQQLWEELDVIKSGKDYGWEALEGQNCFTNNQAVCDAKLNDQNYEPPVYDYPHFDRDLRDGQQQTGFSFTAGHVYSGSIRPDLQGKVLLADFVNENIWSIFPTPANIPWTGAELAVPAAGGVVTMRKDSLNETVILTLGSVGYNLKAAGTQATPKNGVCETGESCKTDPEDCPGLLTGPKSEKWCCANGDCDNTTFSADCPVDCDASATVPGCGNNICDLGENCTSCAQDCSGHIAGIGGLQFCCVGRADFEVECLGDDCAIDSCLKNKRGNKNRKFSNTSDPTP